jgi:hypothetical protein
MMRATEPRDSEQALGDRPRARPSTPSRLREYAAPRLVAYGKLSDLTGAVSNDDFDGAIGSTTTS